MMVLRILKWSVCSTDDKRFHRAAFLLGSQSPSLYHLILIMPGLSVIKPLNL